MAEGIDRMTITTEHVTLRRGDTELLLKGMSCAACALRIEKGLNEMAGVKAAVNFANEKAAIHFDTEKLSIQDLIRKVKEIGYGAEEATDDFEKEQEEKDKEIKNLRNIFIMSAILSLPLFMAMFVGIFSIESLMFLHNPILQLSLAAPVQFIIGFRFYRNSYHNLKAKSPGMDVLVAMGTSAAFFYSVYNGFL